MHRLCSLGLSAPRNRLAAGTVAWEPTDLTIFTHGWMLINRFALNWGESAQPADPRVPPEADPTARANA